MQAVSPEGLKSLLNVGYTISKVYEGFNHCWGPQMLKVSFCCPEEVCNPLLNTDSPLCVTESMSVPITSTIYSISL